MKKFGLVVFILILILVLALTGCSGGSGGGGGNPGGGSDGGGGGNPGGDIVINLAAIPGVVVPVTGEVPVTTPIDTDQYTGTITWSPADNPFAAATVYTANIVLTAKTGYTLNGVAENFFTVAGATTVTNAANSGVVTAVFPKTGAADDVKVDFLSATQIGGASGTADSTALILTFSADPTTLTADNITVTGATKGTLSGSGTTRTLTISNITVLNGETVSVTITSPAGYNISGSPRTAVVYRTLINVTFLSATQSGGTSGTADSKALILTFSADPTTLTANNITVTGATKGTLSGSGTTRTLTISNITVLNGETVSVTITSPSGYNISGSPRTAVVYKAPINVTFLSAAQAYGASGTADSTMLFLYFSAEPKTLTIDNITVTGATKGMLSSTATEMMLTISDITVANGETVSVSITSPPGYNITGSPQTAVVYRALSIGMDYLGGKIAYILGWGDPGYDPNVPHGLIISMERTLQEAGWCHSDYGTTLVGTEVGFGTGAANTAKIAAMNPDGRYCSAALADQFEDGGYTDWFLPSKEEWEAIYSNKAQLESAFGDPFSTYLFYWTSSEVDASNAYKLNMTNGQIISSPKHTNPGHTRPARQF